MSMFRHSNEEEPIAQEEIQFAPSDWQPDEYTLTASDRSKMCRACTNGRGTGICSYHRHEVRVHHKQVMARAKYW